MARLLVVSLLLVALAGCRGEPVPRDYQNHPPAMTNPPQSSTETPSAHGIGEAPPQPTTGVEGTAGPYEPVDPTQQNTTTIADTPPANP
jgi:hypothetical protein